MAARIVCTVPGLGGAAACASVFVESFFARVVAGGIIATADYVVAKIESRVSTVLLKSIRSVDVTLVTPIKTDTTTAI